MRVVQSAAGASAVRLMGAFAVTALLLLGSAAVAGASSTGARGSHGNFCVVSKNVASYLVNIQKQLTAASTPTRLKAEYGAIKSAGPALKSSAPANLKPHVVKVLAFADTIASDLAKANWNIAGLLPYATTLEVQVKKVNPSISALDSYWRTTCKFKF